MDYSYNSCRVFSKVTGSAQQLNLEVEISWQ